ncbi:MAG: hypothetical protein U0905_02415 [Pirellulales bacterium]
MQPLRLPNQRVYGPVPRIDESITKQDTKFLANLEAYFSKIDVGKKLRNIVHWFYVCESKLLA